MTNDSLNECPGCRGPADNGHDRCLPPSPYYCKACSQTLNTSEERDQKSLENEHAQSEISVDIYNCLIGLFEAKVTATNNYPKAVEAIMEAVRPYLRTTDPNRCPHGVWAADRCEDCVKAPEPVSSEPGIKRLQSVRLFLLDKKNACDCENVNTDDYGYQIAMIEGVLDAAGYPYAD